ncbi:MAG: phosphate signaling complex protein PhoU [Gemmatimonadota bacterium]|jgi:phosphate transport system protein|nr:phosphate signaling complex protein PhoU [Gemmatimonadota bacterium]
MSSTTGGRHFHEDLAQLKSRLLEMSSMAEELVERAVEALLERDAEKAASVVAGDSALDQLEVEIDDACIHLLALQQPMARDLRLITMAMKIANDLERVGDHAVNIAQAVSYLAEQPVFAQFAEIEEMARIAREMLSDALDDFVRADAEDAREVCRRDDRVDGLHESMFRILLTHMMEDPRRIGASMSLFLVSRNLERIADLATNIAEDVVFLVEGRSIKHGVEMGRP